MNDEDKTNKQLLKELQESRKQFNDFLHFLPDALLEIDILTPRLTYMNRMAYILFGYTEEDFAEGIELSQLFAENEYERAVEIVTRYVTNSHQSKGEYIRSGKQELYEFLMRRKDGSVFPAETQTSFTLNEDNIPIGMRTLIRDITKRKQVENEIGRHMAQLEALRRGSLELTAELDLDVLLRSIVSRAIELLDGTTGGLYLYRPERDVLEWAMTVDPDLTGPIGTTLRRGEGLSGKVWETGEPLIVDDYRRWEGRVVTFEGYPITAVMGVPVRWGGDFLGVLNIMAGAPRTFSPADVELLNLFATQAAIAIRNAQLLAALKRRGTQLQAAAEVSKSASTILVPEELMKQTVNLIQERFNFYYAGIFLVDEAGKYAVLQAGAGEAGRRMLETGHRLAVGGQSMIGWSVAHAKARIALDVGKEAVRFANPYLPKTRSEMALPLISLGRCIGGLTVQSTEEAAFSEEDITTLQTMADQVAIAIQNARLYEAAQHELAERVRAEEQLRASLREKEVLLKEIHHRVKNNLQLITSLLDLQSDYAQDERILEVFRDSQNRIKLMSSIHERLYQSKDLARIDFGEYVRNLVVHLFRSYGIIGDVIAIKIEVEGIFLGVDTAIPCGLIIHELVSNSLKHAFPGGREGEICIVLRPGDDLPVAPGDSAAQAGDMLALIVSDNGIGFPEDFDFRNTSSLGLQLVSMLTRQLKGAIEFSSKASTPVCGESGATFRITFTPY
jgi:PAS domain S-box-containing protein